MNLSGGLTCALWLVGVMMVLTVESSLAQEALRYSLAGQASAGSRRLRPESLPYTFKTGELRLRVTPSLGVEWNDNVNTSGNDPGSDYILKPVLQFDLSYPATQHNLLSLNVGVGYDKYFEHDELSGWRLQSGSELAFDMYIKDFWINLHDRFSYTQDPAQEAAVANTAIYGTFDNVAGFSVSADLQDVTLSAGYDHVNNLSLEPQYAYQDRASEMFFARAGLQLNPRLLTGLEGTVSFTRYDQPVLNDSTGYSLGAYADWQLGSYFRFRPRGGYAVYQFQQTSQSVLAQDNSSWYADLTVTHQPTEILSYSLSVGHELRLGVQSDLTEDTYARWNGSWGLIKNVSFTPSLFYEHGQQGNITVVGNVAETYDWVGGGLGFSYAFMKAASVSVNYRLTFRSSNYASRDYTQNQVLLQFTYHPQ